MKIDYETYVISLARQPEKRAAFLERNQRTGLEFRRFDAVDGSTLSEQDCARFGLLRPGSRLYTKGQIGCGASHRDLWIYAFTAQKHLLVFEDDAYCRYDLASQLAGVLERLPQWELLLLGYNTDAIVDLQNVPPERVPEIVLNPRPSADQLAAFAQSTDTPQAARLNSAFGLCAYLVSPLGARKLMAAFPMDNRPVWLPDKKPGAGLKAFACMTIDMLTNTLYRDMAAYALMPPLALPLNDPVASTTRLR
jgi:GR25 family glycosyltransferase involved in LPS biosynthesis